MSSQKASLYKQRGSMPVLGERPIPIPAKGQVLVKVLSAGVNTIDVRRIEYDRIVSTQTYPMVLGSDVAGEVVSVGAGVEEFKQGDRVYFQSCPQIRDQSGFQQYALQSHEFIGHTPTHLTNDQASTIPLSSFTALTALFHHTGLHLPPPRELRVSSRSHPPSTSSILILGGSTSTGQFALQFARMIGFKTIITTAAPSHASLVTSLGATHVLDRNAAGAAQRIKQISGEDLRYAFDTISSSDTQRLALEGMAERHPTYLVTVLPPPEDKGGFPRKADGSEWKDVVPSNRCCRDLGTSYYAALEVWFETNQVKVPGVKVVKGGLGAVGEALGMVKGREAVEEKLVIRPWET